MCSLVEGFIKVIHDIFKPIKTWCNTSLVHCLGRCGIGFSGISCTGYIRFVFALDEGLVSRNRLPASRLVEYFLEELDILKREAV